MLTDELCMTEKSPEKLWVTAKAKLYGGGKKNNNKNDLLDFIKIYVRILNLILFKPNGINR